MAGSHLQRVLVSAALLLALVGCGGSETIASPPVELVGRWSGRARVGVEWCEREHLSVRLEISERGVVSGVVGEASLPRGRLVPDHGWFGRRSQWVVRGSLEGDLLEDQGVRRTSISIPFDLRDGRIEGSLRTSGRLLSGRDCGVFRASELSLAKR